MDPITIAQFRTDFPMFASTTDYPDSMITFYILFVTNLMQNAVKLWGNMYQQGMELAVAHYATLYKMAADAANVGGYPGLAKGAISSETPGTVSLSYDTVLTSEERGGNWNLTQWGQQFLRLARLIGMGPRLMNVGCGDAAGAVVGQMGAWPGPSTGSGFSF